MGVKFTAVSIETAATVMMFMMVFLMPLIDHLICSKLGLNLRDGVSENPKADDLLHLRKMILILIFIAYLALLGYVAFFSRSAADDYLLHISFYEDLNNSVKIDYGILELIKLFFTEGPASALSHVKIVNMDDLMQPFQKRWYYCRGMQGSYSIKYVLPALFPDDPELDYHNLEGVHNGAEASAAFEAMADVPEEELLAYREHLLKYCRLDTLAMVKIWEKLREVAC